MEEFARHLAIGFQEARKREDQSRPQEHHAALKHDLESITHIGQPIPSPKSAPHSTPTAPARKFYRG